MKVFTDMDGVLANFFSEYALLAGIPSGNYREVPSVKVDPTLDKIVGTDFFARLPKFPTTDALLNMVIALVGEYHICSSPLRGDHEGSAKHKRIWIEKHLSPLPASVLLVANKSLYAKEDNGTPNILIDDRRSNILEWEAAGGYGIKYQADEDGLHVVEEGLQRILRLHSR